MSKKNDTKPIGVLINVDSYFYNSNFKFYCIYNAC